MGQAGRQDQGASPCGKGRPRCRSLPPLHKDVSGHIPRLIGGGMWDTHTGQCRWWARHVQQMVICNSLFENDAAVHVWLNLLGSGCLCVHL